MERRFGSISLYYVSLGKILVSWASVSLCVKGGDCPRERSRGPFRSDFLRFKNSQLSVDPARAPAALSLWSPRDTRRTVFPGARDPPWSGGQGRGACWRLQGGWAPGGLREISFCSSGLEIHWVRRAKPWGCLDLASCPEPSCIPPHVRSLLCAWVLFRPGPATRCGPMAGVRQECSPCPGCHLSVAFITRRGPTMNPFPPPPPQLCFPSPRPKLELLISCPHSLAG